MPRDHPDWKSSAARYTREVPEVRRRLLIAAATRCLEKGGIKAFSVERIRREAGVSRGLINHYFDGLGDLLAAVYREVLNETMTLHIEQVDAMPKTAAATDRLRALVEACFLPNTFDRYTILVWLALWGEIVNNPKLRAIHRDHYTTYRLHLAREIADVAEGRNLILDAGALAGSYIALLDGLWLEWCQDEELMSPTEAQAACWDLLETKLGSLR